MSRLWVRLALSMVGTMVFSLVIIAGTQRLAEYRAYWSLPEAARVGIPPPRAWFGLAFDRIFPSPRMPPPGPGAAGEGGLSAEPQGLARAAPTATPVQSATSVAGLTEVQEPAAEAAAAQVAVIPAEDARLADLADGSAAAFATPPADTEAINTRLANNFESFRRYQDESFMLGVALASLVSLGLALWLSRRIAAPVVRVSEAATEVAGGNLGARVPLTPAQRRSGLETLRLSENFNRMAASLEGYEAERRAMIADIAHELRTPLTAMKLRLQALEDGLLPFDVKEAASLNRSTDLLTRLVEDLRTISLADAGRLKLQLAEVDITELTRDLLEDHAPRFAHKGVSTSLDAPEHPIRLAVDRDRVRQILGNLLDNALRVSPEGGKIAVSLRQVGGWLRLAVNDSGPGLTPEALHHAFDRFFQDQDLSHARAGGSGLGLAIVHALVRLHGGNVTATNHAGGARFEVMLPADAET